MENKELIDKIVYYAANSKDNFISDEDAISPNLAGMKIYEEPLIQYKINNQKIKGQNLQR